LHEAIGYPFKIKHNKSVNRHDSQYQNRIANSITYLITRAVICAIIGAIFCYASTFAIILPQAKALWLTENIVEHIQQAPFPAPSSELPLLTTEYDEPSLIFRLGTKAVTKTSLTSLSSQLGHQPRWLLIERNELEQLRTLPIARQEIAEINGLQYSKMHWRHYLLLRVRSK
jgi:hypothetical protein